MNALDRYFAETGENASKLADRIGCAPTTITRPLRGERNASMDVALNVERATEGRVSATEFLDICIQARRAHDGNVEQRQALVTTNPLQDVA